MSKQILNLIEPTLFDQTGHGFSYVNSLLTASNADDFTMHVWLDNRGNNLLQASLCTTHAYFSRKFRQVQKIKLYLALLKKPEIIFVCTSDLWDLKIIAFYQKYFAFKAKVFLHFHQFKQNPSKLAALKKIAALGTAINILTPTSKLAEVFINNGFKNVSVVPCPTFTPARTVSSNIDNFNKILYAGAARKDKGFPLVVQLLQYLRRKNIVTKFEIQVSAPNSQRYDHATEQALRALQTLPAANVILHDTTLDQVQYLNLFNNAICLLLYDQNAYQDKFSGVALDAFYAGCPIITAQNTWMGDQVEKYGAGIALKDYDVVSIHKAIDTIMQNYAKYNANSKRAAAELAQEHDPKNTLACL